MGRTVSPAIVAMNGGEISPLLGGRVDLEDRYPRSAFECTNYVPTPQGPITRRPGTYFVSSTRADASVRLIPFLATGDVVYILEFGENYIQFYKNYTSLSTPAAPGVAGNPFSSAFSTAFGDILIVATTYTLAQVWDLQFAQAAGVMYLTHRSHPPRVLTWFSDFVWTFDEFQISDGPYLPENTDSAATFTATAVSGTTTITGVAAVIPYINSGLGFQAGDVAQTYPPMLARLIRLRHTGTTPPSAGWAYLKTQVSPNTTRIVTATVLDEFAAITATYRWRLGVYTEYGPSFPGAVAIHGDRLFFGGTNTYPSRVDGSVVGNYSLFWPFDPDGTSQAPVASDAIAVSLPDGVDIRWMRSDPRGLIVGTSGGVFLLRANISGGALSATDPVGVVKSINHGVDSARPVQADNSIIYAQRGGSRIQELSYVFEDDGIRNKDVSLVAPHLFPGGILQLAFQSLPHSVVWVLRDDGVLIGMVYDKSQGISAWFRCELGGEFNGGVPVVETIAVIPAPSGVVDDLWMVVKRTVAGETVRYTEFISLFWRPTYVQNSAIFLDSAITYSGAATQTIAGIDHLSGATLAVLADGAVHPDVEVIGGEVTLNRAASVVQLGYPFSSRFQSVSVEAGSEIGTAQGKRKRIHALTMRLFQTLGVEVGPDFDHLTMVPFRTTGDVLGAPPPLFDGDKDVVFPQTLNNLGQICIQQTDPVPGTIVALFPQLQTGEGR